MMYVCAVKLSPDYFSPIYGIGEVKWSDVKVAQLCPTLCSSMDYTYSLWNSPGQNTGVGSHSLPQGIFPTQGSNPGLLSHKGSLMSNKGQGKFFNTPNIYFTDNGAGSSLSKQ